MTSPDPRRLLPSVSAVVTAPELSPLIARLGRARVVAGVRNHLERLRRQPPANIPDVEAIVTDIVADAERTERERLGTVINATGVVLHTGLGRAPLSARAQAALLQASGACNLEVGLVSGERGPRGALIAEFWSALTGCEDALVVNNNAAATLLTLQALCAGREVLISRGQLIEIGGSFRLPEIFSASGARLREVGCTNRTRLDDYETAIGPETAAILHVHPSNYRVIGFAETPSTAELAALARQHSLLMIDDVGSGCIVRTDAFGLPAEPTFQESLASGADLVLGSGDKLLGGPQAGIVLGKANWIDRLRRHPLARAVRIDKLSLAAHLATLESYLQGDPMQEIPVLAQLSASTESLRRRAARIVNATSDLASLSLEIAEDRAPVGGGTLPGVETPTIVLLVRHGAQTAEALALRLRTGAIRVFPRILRGHVCVDLRSVLPEQDEQLLAALRGLVGETPPGQESRAAM